MMQEKWCQVDDQDLFCLREIFNHHPRLGLPSHGNAEGDRGLGKEGRVDACDLLLEGLS